MNYTNIIELIIQKKEDGFKLLYEEYGSKLYFHSVSRWNNSEDDSWELVYSTLLKTVEGINRYEFESEKHFQNWMYKVFKNEFLQKKRKEKNLKIQFTTVDFKEVENYVGDQDLSSFTSNMKLIEDDLINSEDNSTENASLLRIRQALKSLDEDDSSILLLRSQNFTYVEIAAFLKLNETNLKVKHFRAKNKLIKAYNKQ